MKRFLLKFAMIFLCAPCMVFAQPQAVFKRFTPDQNIINNELLFSSDDSTFFVAGGQQYPGWGTHVTKFDMNGSPLWSKRYSYTTYEHYPDIHVTSWGDILITTYPPNFDFRIHCVDANGNYKWGSFSSNVQFNYHTTSYDDGSIYMIGYSSSGPYIFKTNSSGTLKWKKTYSNIPLNASNFNEVVHIGETGLLIGGYSNTYGTTVVIHIDSTGAVLSSKALISSIQPLTFWKMKFYNIGQNKIWLSGITGTNAIIAESDTSGNIQWVRKFTSPGCRLGTMSLSAFPSGEIAFSSIYNDTINGFRGSCAGILHPDGTFDHAFSFGADDSLFQHDIVHAVALKNGKLVVSAFERLLPVNSGYNPLIGIIDSAYTGSGSCYTTPVQLYSDTISFSYISIATDSASTSYPNYLMSPFGVAASIPYDSLLCASVTSVEEPLSLGESIGVYPNPASEWIVLSGTKSGGLVNLYDVTGKLCLKSRCDDGRTILNSGTLRSGLYILTYSYLSVRETRKVIITDLSEN